MEHVFDLYTFEEGWFVSGGFGGASSAGGGDIKGYAGIVIGWSNFNMPTMRNYEGRYFSFSVDGTVDIASAGVMVAASADNNGDINGNLFVVALEGAVGAHAWPFPASASVTSRGNARLIGSTPFRSGNTPNRLDSVAFATYIMMQNDIDIQRRIAAIAVVLYNGVAWETQP